MNQSKRCTGCGETKPLSEYNKRTDRDCLKARCKACYSEYDKRRYAKNGYSREAARKNYLSNRESRIAYAAKWARRNPEKRLLAKAKRRAIVTPGQVSERQLADRVQAFGGLCWMCGAPYEQIDHVKPLSKGGPHLAANLRPACAECNRAKGARWHGVKGIPVLLHEVLASRSREAR